MAGYGNNPSKTNYGCFVGSILDELRITFHFGNTKATPFL